MLETADEMAKEAKLPLVLVLGEMLELGEAAASEHKILGAKMGAVSPDFVFWKGGHAAEVCAGLEQVGYGKNFIPVGDAASFGKLLKQLPARGAVVLFKGSRGNKLEELAAVFKNMLFANQPEQKG
jgi:UDP-N-acetylmuramoyl-tripeptide--D-alanyl-D-alanine ligase